MRKKIRITYQEKINQAVNYLTQKLNQTPGVGIILGTGLGSLLNEIEIIIEIPFEEIPHFPISTVASHPGKLRKSVYLIFCGPQRKQNPPCEKSCSNF